MYGLAKFFICLKLVIRINNVYTIREALSTKEKMVQMVKSDVELEVEVAYKRKTDFKFGKTIAEPPRSLEVDTISRSYCISMMAHQGTDPCRPVCSSQGIRENSCREDMHLERKKHGDKNICSGKDTVNTNAQEILDITKRLFLTFLLLGGLIVYGDRFQLIHTVSGRILETLPLVVNAVPWESVTIPCNQQEIRQGEKSWYKEDGPMPRTCSVASGDLVISRVYPNDTGTYVCHVDDYEDSKSRLVVSPLVPRFTQDPISYILLSLQNEYSSLEVGVIFSPEVNNCILLLYQGMEDGKSFTLSFGLEEGYPVLKYYVSEIQHSHMKIGRVLEPYAWHSFNLVITKDLGTIYVDNNTYLIASEALGVEMSQNLTGNLFVGNHPDDNVAIFGKGFKGVVVEMKIHGDMVNFEAEMLVGIDQYNACEYDPCETGECVIANVKFGYKCVSDSKVSAQYSDHDKGNGDESCLVEVNEKSEAVFRWTTKQLNQIMDVLVNDRLIAIYVPIHNESYLYNNNDSNLYAPLLTGSGMCQLLIKQFIRPGFKVMIRGTDIQKVEVSGKLAANCRNASSLWIYFKVNDADTSISPSVIVASILGTVVLAGAVIGVCLRRYRTATKKGMCEREKKTSRSKPLMQNEDTAV